MDTERERLETENSEPVIEPGAPDSQNTETPVENSIPSAEYSTVEKEEPVTEASPTTGSAATETPYVYQEPTEPEEPVKEEKKGFLRACRSWTDIIPVAALLSVLLILVGELVTEVLTDHLFNASDWLTQFTHDPDISQFLLMYFAPFGIWLVFMLVIAIFKDNWPMWKAFLYNGHGNNLKAIPIGILLGGGMNAFCVLASWFRGDIILSFNGFRPLLFLAFLLCVMIQSGAEEITDRCYLYQKLRRRYRWPIIAILINALVFMALHMGNPGVTQLGLLQVFMIGVLFSLIIYFFDSLWTVIWAHTAWNFSQSIVFGLPNSGIVSKYSVFKLEAASARDGLFYNTSFGVEGSLGANVIIGAMCLIVLIYGLATKRGERMDHWKELEEKDRNVKHIWEPIVLTVIMLLCAFIGYRIISFQNQHPEIYEQMIEDMQEAVEEAQQETGGQTAQPEDAVQPEAQPGDTVQPGAQPGDTVQPEAQPGDAGQQAQPGDTVQPEAQPGDAGQQAQPEAQPGGAEQQETQPSQPDNAEQPETQPGGAEQQTQPEETGTQEIPAGTI